MDQIEKDNNWPKSKNRNIVKDDKGIAK